jgi:hypothetical protein
MKASMAVFIGLTMVVFGVFAQDGTDHCIFTVNEKRVTVGNVMATTRQQYVSNIMSLLSWTNSAALDKELRYILPVVVHPVSRSDVEGAVGKYYDDDLRSRLAMLLAHMVAEEKGVTGFHYDKELIADVLRQSSEYQLEWNHVLESMIANRDADDARAKIEAFDRKWLSSYPWYSNKFTTSSCDSYVALLDCNAIAIDLAKVRVADGDGFDQASFERMIVDLGNFAYDTRHKVQPKIATNYLHEYLKQYVKYNVFVVRMAEQTSLDRVVDTVQKFVTKDGQVASASVERFNHSMEDMGGSVAVMQMALDKDQFKSRFGTNLDLDLNPHFLLAKIDKIQSGFPKWKEETKTPFYACVVVNAVKGSEMYAAKYASPEMGSFGNYISERYLRSLVEEFFKKVDVKDKELFPSVEDVSVLLDGLNVASVFYGFKDNEIKPID